MNRQDQLLQVIQNNPADAKLIFADWLEEDGQPDLAHAFRWSASHGKHPALCSNTNYWGWSRTGYEKELRKHLIPELFHKLPATPFEEYNILNAFIRLSVALKAVGEI